IDSHIMDQNTSTNSRPCKRDHGVTNFKPKLQNKYATSGANHKEKKTLIIFLSWKRE
ncbi:hypothetical protein ACJX0J_022127, partial [Zea mays]